MRPSEWGAPEPTYPGDAWTIGDPAPADPVPAQRFAADLPAADQLPAAYASPSYPVAEHFPVGEHFPAGDGYPAENGYPADEGYELASEEEPAQARPAASRIPGGQYWPDQREARRAMAAYLTVPFFGLVVPLVVYLGARRRYPWLRAHAAQALNVWVTVSLYEVSITLMGVMLALDSIQVAVIVVLPVLVVLWLTALVFLIRAAGKASRGDEYAFPHWLCTRVAR
ncbi:MAG TPA: DUF4870 domain-containing protein [Streptosporangiaceae bacterium]|nr:DUF4870 domain-containing protein [Streptosporangiaceae bacterium]